MLVGGTLAGAALLGSAGATSTFSFTRLGGINRFDTARIIGSNTYPSGTPNAIIATGYNFPDALAGNYLAGLKGAPIILVLPSNPIPAEALAELQALKTKNVWIVGGTSAVGADVATTLSNTTSTAPGGGNLVVNRVFGDNRYLTMKAINQSPGAPVGINTAVLATGRDFPDALSGGAIAFAKHFPLILTDGQQTTLSPEAQAVITSNNISHLIVAGGSAAINPSQYTNLPGVTIDEVAQGTDRSGTSQLLADYAIAHLGFSNTHFNLANGFNPATDLPAGSPPGFSPDALTGGPHSGSESAPTVLTLNPTTPGNAAQFATEHASTEGTGHIFGGTAAVTDQTAATITTDAGVTTPTTLPPTPPGGGLGTVPTTLGPDLLSCTITKDNFAAGAASQIQYVFDKPVLGATLDPADYTLDGYLITHHAAATGAAVNASNPNAVDTTFPAGSGVGDPAFYTICDVNSDSPVAGAAIANNGGGVSNPLESQLLGGSVIVPGQGNGNTDCPDLLSAQPTPGDGTHTKVDFTFDKNVTAANPTTGFVFYDGAGAPHVSVGPNVLQPGGNPVTATFGLNVTTATRFAVTNVPGAATNGTCVNPEGAVNFGSLTSPSPNLISVNRKTPNGNIFTFAYDKDITLTAVAPHFHVYLNTGVGFAATVASLIQTGARTVDATFAGINSSNSGGVVLGTDDAGADIVGTVSALHDSIGAAPVSVSGPGPTNGPVAVSATRDNAANNATITFNQPINNTGAFVPVPANFYVISNTNTPIAATGIVSVSGNTVVLHWAAAGAIANGVGVGVSTTEGAAPPLEEGAFILTGAFNLDGIGNAPNTVALS